MPHPLPKYPPPRPSSECLCRASPHSCNLDLPVLWNLIVCAGQSGKCNHIRRWYFLHRLPPDTKCLAPCHPTRPATSPIVIETTCSLARLAPALAPMSEAGCILLSSRQRDSVGQFGHGNKQSRLTKFESLTARNTIRFLSWHMSALMFQRETCFERKYHSFSAIFAKLYLILSTACRNSQSPRFLLS